MEQLLLVASIYLVAFVNTAFWHRLLAGRAFADWHTWMFALAVGVVLVCVHFFALAAVATRRTVRPLLLLLGLAAAAANFYSHRYGVVVDATMARSIVHTDLHEAAELVTGDMLLALLFGGLPLVLLWNVRLRQRGPWRRLVRRSTAMAVAAVTAASALILVYQEASSLMRTHHDLRYTIVPASLVWSFSQVMAADTRTATVQRDPPEPVHRAEGTQRHKPLLLVMVVGETARAANFALNGYPRSTTPELLRQALINFPRVRACGTSTEVSLPCMFSPFGRADYDEARIRRHESLLHVVGHAGFRVVWLDNQAGCKGVCDGIEYRNLTHAQVPQLCEAEQCYDGILPHTLAQVAEQSDGDLVVVLHQLGNHGPAYFRRYPAEFKRFTPACEKDELGECTPQQIVNAYDNAIAYTDHVLTRVIGTLERLRARFDVVMVYASDHGESLGEKGLFLHGLPYAIAPEEQLRVPMFWWLPPSSAADLGIDVRCMRAETANEVSHDHLYHSVMGLLGLKSARYRSERDLFARCRERTPGALTAASR